MVYSIENPLKFRTNVVNKLKENFDDFINDENNTFFINLEKGIFNYAIKEATSKKIIKKWDNIYFAQLYVDRLRSIFNNLKNPQFQEIIKTDEISPQTIAFMTHQEMNPERWRTLINNKILRDASKYVTNIAASTDMYTCKKCKSKKCTYYELQTRSADEPATIFVTCLDCGKHWKG
jgi:transcription elongation factor S-II